MRGLSLQGHVTKAKATRLRRTLDDDEHPPLPAWGATGLPPNSTPWGHMEKFTERL